MVALPSYRAHNFLPASENFIEVRACASAVGKNRAGLR